MRQVRWIPLKYGAAGGVFGEFERPVQAALAIEESGDRLADRIVTVQGEKFDRRGAVEPTSIDDRAVRVGWLKVRFGNSSGEIPAPRQLAAVLSYL